MTEEASDAVMHEQPQQRQQELEEQQILHSAPQGQLGGKEVPTLQEAAAAAAQALDAVMEEQQVTLQEASAA
eukprot:scaffold155813_cov10-Tisochrysis_lutea.AAC.1